MDFSKLSDKQLKEYSSSISKELKKRKQLEPNFHSVNLEKSLLKTYTQYQYIYKISKNPAWDLHKITGWSFEQFKEFLKPHIKKLILDKVQIIAGWRSLIQELIEKRREEWQKNNPSTIKSGFCDDCNCHYIGDVCNNH